MKNFISIAIDSVLYLASKPQANVEAIKAFREGQYGITELAEKIQFSESAIDALKATIEDTNAELLVHSGWRKRFGSLKTIELITSKGIDATWLANDPFPPIKMSSYTSNEIAWSYERKIKLHGPCNIAIVDKVKHYNEHSQFNPHNLSFKSVVTEPNRGFSKKTYFQVLKILSSNETHND